MTGHTEAESLAAGREVNYYPRQGKPGHPVMIIKITPHVFHRALVRFRYRNGREREVTIGRFYMNPE